MTTLSISSDSFSRLPGLRIFEKIFSGQISDGGVLLEFEPGREQAGFTWTCSDGRCRVRYARPCDAYRALGLLLAEESVSAERSQNCTHESLGVMWDVSRNAVLHLEGWERLLQKFALLGINSVQVYMEDVYVIPGEPLFGYGRGGYSAEELRQIDDYAQNFGIEIIPCIQTLGHLEQIFQWPAYADDADVSGVLMVGEERTRNLIGKMLDQVAACFRSRTVHIGMDEAHGIGTGKYLRKHGYRRPFDILNEHLKMVVDMCKERGLHPMMWSDMYFRIGSANNNYYDQESLIPDEVAAQVPADVDLVYWDYYHTDTAFYEEWIQRHRKMGKEPILATGIWSWGRFWAYEAQWKASLDAGMRAAGSKKLSHVFATAWGDDGAEFLPESVLPAIQYFAEWAYTGEPDQEALKRQFGVLSGAACLDDYILASQIDRVPGIKKMLYPVNYSRWILWGDPVLGHMDAHITPDLPEHYRKLAEALDKSKTDEALCFVTQLARALSLKAELHLKARTAWREKDMDEIKRLQTEVLPKCLEAVRKLWQIHETAWMRWSKPFGWEIVEHRYAGCAAR
ncbi:MAG: family 20 glycosylhydrolase, partial [Chthoniobacterales bacterium]